MGYIIAGIVVVIGVILVAFLLSSRSGAGSGRVAPAGVKPVERSEPSAEAPNPAASSVADPDTAQAAQRRTHPS